jgi:transposase InsO family protein
MVQMDCFFIGRLSGAKGAVWQYTAIDVASAYCWAELHLTPRNPSARWTSELARRVAADLAARGWTLEKVMSDNASEFGSAEFEAAVARLGARHLFIRAGRPQTMRVWMSLCWSSNSKTLTRSPRVAPADDARAVARGHAR